MMDCMTADGGNEDLTWQAINDPAGVLDIPRLKAKYKAGECISLFRNQKGYDGTEKCGSDVPKNTGETSHLGSTSSESYMCAYLKNYEQAVKKGIELEESVIKNLFQIRTRNERAGSCGSLPIYGPITTQKHTAFSIINHYVDFLERNDCLPRWLWELDEDWAWFIGENREKIRLTTQPEPYTLERALNWVQRQVAPTIKMLQELDKQNNTTILKDMIKNAELKKKHKHLLELEKSNIEDRIYTDISQEDDGIF